MKRYTLFLTIFIAVTTRAQYLGGNNDGYSVSNIFSQPLFPNIYLGGNNDGFSRFGTLGQAVFQNIYKGGTNDGYSASASFAQSVLPNIYHGGFNDGFSRIQVTQQNPLPNIYRGSNGDGFAIFPSITQTTLPNIYQGGVNDGYSASAGFNQAQLPDIYRGGHNDGFSGSTVFSQITLPDIYRGGFNDGFSKFVVTNQNPSPASMTCPPGVIVSCISEIPTCPADLAAFLALPGASISNFCSANLTFNCQTSALVGNSCGGTITRTFTISDDCGSIVSCTQVFTIDDNTNPIAVNPAPITLQCISEIPVADPAVVINETDNCGSPNVTLHQETNNSGTGCPGNPFIVTRVYRVEDACGNFTDVTHTLTALDNVLPVISDCKTSATRLFDPGETNYTIQGEEFDVNATDNCALASLTYSLSGASIGTGTSLSNVDLPLGVTTILWTAIDNCGNAQTCQFTVTVGKRPVIIVYTGDNEEQYSDRTELKAELRDQLTNNMLAGKTIQFTIGIQNTTALTNIGGLASTTMHMFQDVNDYDVTAAFAGDDIYGSATITEDYDIKKENATAEYTGPEFISVPCTSCTSTTVLLSALITDTTSGTPPGDPFPGDIRKARVKFINVNTLASLSGWLTPGLLNPDDTTRGVVTYQWTVPLPNTGYDSYTIGIVIDAANTNPPVGNYIGYAQTVVNISRGTLNEFITGGGHIRPTASGGSYSSDPSKKVNFGFNVKWNKSMKNLQGNVSILFRKGGQVYQVKSTSMTSLSINSANPCSKKAIFISKANLQNVTNPNIPPVAVLGNLTLQLDLTDNGEPGTDNDRIGIALFNGNTLVYASHIPYNITLPLQGGNIVVHNGQTCNGQSRGEPAAEWVEIKHQDLFGNLEVIAYPNPAQKEFVLEIKGNDSDPVEITIYDINGKIRHQVSSGVIGQHRFGVNWTPGIYVAVIRQGTEQKTIKLVKQ